MPFVWQNRRGEMLCVYVQHTGDWSAERDSRDRRTSRRAWNSLSYYEVCGRADGQAGAFGKHADGYSADSVSCWRRDESGQLFVLSIEKMQKK